MKRLLVVVLAVGLAGCGIFGDTKPDVGNPLAVAECPAILPEIAGDTFGDVIKSAVEWANTYHRCRRAAVGVR